MSDLLSFYLSIYLYLSVCLSVPPSVLPYICLSIWPLYSSCLFVLSLGAHPPVKMTTCHFLNFPPAVDLEKQRVAFLVSCGGVVHKNSRICYTQDRFTNFAQKAMGFAKRLCLALRAVPSLPPLQPLPHGPCTPGREPRASGNRRSCIVHSAEVPGLLVGRHVAFLFVTPTFLLRSNLDSKAFHYSPFCYSYGQENF